MYLVNPMEDFVHQKINNNVSPTEIYFETGVTGWIFSSGDARSLDSGDFISPYTGDQTLTSFGTGQIANFDFTPKTI